MALDLMRSHKTEVVHEGTRFVSNDCVDAAWLVARLAEECPEIVYECYDEDRGSVSLDSADYEVPPRGLRVRANGKVWRICAVAYEIDEAKEDADPSWRKETVIDVHKKSKSAGD